MDKFTGHALPGSFFILFAFWWTTQIFSRFFQCKKKNKNFTSTLTYPCTFLFEWLKNWPIEAIFKILFPLVGFLSEMIYGLVYPLYGGNWHHVAMYLMFLLMGIADLLMFYTTCLPTSTDYVILALTLMTELILIKFHITGTKPVNIFAHILLIYIVVASILLLLLEIKYRHNILISLVRTYLFFLQGTWLWQTGYILTGFKKFSMDLTTQHKEALITSFFIMHCAGLFIFMLLTGTLISCYWSHQGCPEDGAVMHKDKVRSLSGNDECNGEYSPA